jgi:signal transduction histidine kinase
VIVLILLVAVPLLLLIVGRTSWVLVGRALSPVERMRQEVAAISAGELERRVPEGSGDDEISRLAETMNEMLGRLESSREKQQRLVSDASHELRNPVAAIRQYAEVALAHPEQTTTAQLAANVLGEDLRLQRVAEDLLLLARSDEGALKMGARSVDLDDLVLEEARHLQQTTDLRIDATGISAARLVGDEALLRRLIRNLTDNAARHASSTIALSVAEEGDRVVLTVDDDGTGIDPGDRKVVFERFGRLDEARDRRHGGAGLGLAIVVEIAAAHGGSASITDSPIGGARFLVLFPGAD